MALEFEALPDSAGRRLDHVLHEWMPGQSRSRIQTWIKDGRVRVNGSLAKPSFELQGGERIEVEPADPPPLKASAEDLPIEVLYQDRDVVVVNKPAGMVVHPGAGVARGTLVNALLHHFQSLSGVQGDLRPGIVHRLDRFTSGALVVAKNDDAHRELQRQFAEREVRKIYSALVQGQPPDAGRIEKPIARDRVRRTRMTTRTGQGREADTAYEVVERFERCSLLRVDLGTGRTHQIRVHLASLGHPVVGDTLYGAAAVPGLGRFLLHAYQLTFRSPANREVVTVTARLAPEFEAFLTTLR